MSGNKWIKCCNELLDLVEASQGSGIGGYDHDKLQALIRYLYPHTHSLQASRDPSSDARTKSLEMLLELPVKIRRRVLLHASEDLHHLFPKRTERLSDCLAPKPDPVSKRRKNTEKLNRYLRRIDGAIATGRYTFAMKLTNRCLKEYYRSYLKAMRHQYELRTENVQWMSISVVRYLVTYFKKHSIPYSERRLLLMTTVSNVLFITMSRLKTSSGSYAVDKAIAVYARNNMKRIARYLSRYI